MAGRIVTYVHRPKRPPRKRKAVAIAGPAIVRKVKGAGVPTSGKPEPAIPPPPANDDRKPPRPGARKPAIVTSTSRTHASLPRVPDMSPEEYERRGEAAAELWRELVRRAGRGSEDQEP